MARDKDHIKVIMARLKNEIVNHKLMSMNNIIVSLVIEPKYTPAITIVELCKRALIGVGAFVAFNDREIIDNKKREKNH